MINPRGVSFVRGRLMLDRPKMKSTPWPFTNTSAMNVSREWAASMLSIQRRHDKHYARLVWHHMRAWRKAWGWESGRQ